MVWGGVEPGARMWDTSSLYPEESTMASGWSRERVSDHGSALQGQRGGQIGDMFEGELTRVADGVETECEEERKIQFDSRVS